MVALKAVDPPSKVGLFLEAAKPEMGISDIVIIRESMTDSTRLLVVTVMAFVPDVSHISSQNP
jgi:hypothetical protein